jgi:7 transmembrane helices usually fused to an inactive transglutaminase/Transglutaminase-like superfamily
MSRTTLCLITAGLLATASLGFMAVRRYVLGDEIVVPAGPGTFKVTVLVRGKSQGSAKVQMFCPLDFKQQHVFREEFASQEMTEKAIENRNKDRRQVLWIQKAAGARTAFEARYEFYCAVDVQRPTAPMAKLARQIYDPPYAGEFIHAEAFIDPDERQISDLAMSLSEKHDATLEQVRVLFHYVADNIRNDPAIGGTSQGAVECLKAKHGDAAAKSRLLVALCRSRGIPARIITGLTLDKRCDQTAHYWVEAWVGDHWLPMCPFYHHYGSVPSTYLVFAVGDFNLIRGHNVRDLDYACLAEHHKAVAETPGDAGTWLQRFFRTLSLDAPPPDERGLVEFLLLLPVAALIICICRNLIGMHCFGTFAPALIGLAFREWESLPGILVFVSVILIGWGMRRVLDRYHLLQVPRTSFLLSLVVLLLLGTVLVANHQDLAFTHYFSLVPIVILTGMIERFWTLETEDGTTSSFKTLVQTMVIAALISMTASRHFLVNHLMHYPETLGLVMALQLVIGRYTGYRLSELFRFRDLVEPPPPEAEVA